MDKNNIIFLPQNEEGTRYRAAIILNNNGGGRLIGEDIPSICVIEYLQSH